MAKVIAAPHFAKLLSGVASVDGRRLLRIFALVSCAYSFWMIFDMDHYLPWQVRFLRAAELTLIGHFGLWLATFEWQGWLRFVVALGLIPTALGVSILWGHVDTLAAFAVLGWLGVRVVQILKGSPRSA